jgi:hypothetical protein
MRSWAKTLLLGASLAFLGATPSSAWAKTAGYCVECHSRKFVVQYNASIIAGGRSVYHAKLDPCPGVRSLSEEIFFTESRIVNLDEILQTMEQEGWSSDGLRKKVSEAVASLFALKNSKTVSIAQITQETSALRASLQKVYDRALQARSESARRWLIGLGSLVFLAVLVLLGVGYRKLNRMGKTLLLFALIAGSLSLNACSSGPAEPAKKSPAQERLEQSLDVARQSAGKMEETFYQSFLLAEMAREWSKIESGPAEKAFQLAWQMALTAREKANQTRALQEVVSRWPDPEQALREKVNFDSVLDLRDELRNANGRTWALRAVAEEWVQANEKKGRGALEFALQEAMKMEDAELRDRELKSIAGSWVGFDESRALEISRSISDPFLKALALCGVALSTHSQDKAGAILSEAWAAAETMAQSYSQVKAFIRIAAASARTHPRERTTWKERALAKIQSLGNPQLKSFALQEMVFQWAALDWERAERLAGEISPVFPEARAYSFIYLSGKTEEKGKALGLLKRALAETAKVADPFEAQKIKSLIGMGLARLDPGEAFRLLPKITDPYYRSEILRELAREFSRKDKRKALDLVEKIPLEDLRIQIMVGVIRQWMPEEHEKISSLYREGLHATLSISDPFDRALMQIELGKNWGRLEPGKGAAALDWAWKSAREISSAGMKAEIFETLAEAWRNSDRTQAQKILEAIDPSVTRARKSLEEIRLWAKTHPEKALRWAEAIPAGLPLEKVAALKEVASGMKKTQPVFASDIFGKALEQALTLPEEPKSRKLLSQLVVESALLNREKTFRRILQIPNRETRDLLLTEASNAWAKEDSLWALKAADEIFESARRLALYQKIAAGEAKNLGPGKPDRLNHPALRALGQWGVGREKAKKEESQATAFFEKALVEIGKIQDGRQQSYFLSGLAADWALIDEEKAMRVAGKISPHYAEPFSYALLQVGTQLRKWNRKAAESVFQKTISATAQIPNASLRGRRLLQLALQWQILDPAKGQEVLKMAENEARKNIFLPGKDEKILTDIFLTQARLNPAAVLSQARKAGSPSIQARVLLEGARVLHKGSVEENVRALEKGLQFAQRKKNPRLTAEIATAWFSLEPAKGLEVLAQVEPKENRVQTLRQMVWQSVSLRKERGEGQRLLERAIQEALGIEGLGEKIKSLGEIARDWVGLDKERAKSTYLQAYQLVEKAEISSPKFSSP